jgi:hypothetical protein
MSNKYKKARDSSPKSIFSAETSDTLLDENKSESGSDSDIHQSLPTIVLMLLFGSS